ncbi:MAG: SDR family oxidoreductase [Candidatus Dormiibacterota bacterium]
MSERKVAVITGASAGVGRATAVAFAARGFDVALLARGPAGLAGAASDVEAAGGRATIIPTDVSQFAQVEAAAALVEKEMGPIDVWVNDAMTTVFAPSWEVKPEDFQRAVEVTFLGQVWGTGVALSLMRPRNRGSIVNVGSALAFVGIPLQSAYCASKFACRGYFESVRAELLHEGSQIRLSMVHLPAVNTPQFDWCQTTMTHHPQPVPPIYQPEIPAKFILEAALSGQPVKVVGSWNKMLVLLGRAFPGLGNQFSAIGAWDSQLTKAPLSPTRRVNLHQPVDDVRDHGAHGIFDQEAGGFLDPSFLKTLPKTLGLFGIALARTADEKQATYRRRAQLRYPPQLDQKRASEPPRRDFIDSLLLAVGPGYRRHLAGRPGRPYSRSGQVD